MQRRSFIFLCAAAVFGVVATIVLYLVDDMRRRALTAEISPNALVAGNLETVVFSPQANREVVRSVVARLAEYRGPTNGLFLNDRELDAQIIEALGTMTRLKSLCLARTNLTDSDLQHFRRLRKLRTLTLTETKVSDVGLQYLKPLTSLRELHVEATEVTEEGLLQLKKVLPDMDVDDSLRYIRSKTKSSK